MECSDWFHQAQLLVERGPAFRQQRQESPGDPRYLVVGDRESASPRNSLEICCLFGLLDRGHRGVRSASLALGLGPDQRFGPGGCGLPRRGVSARTRQVRRECHVQGRWRCRKSSPGYASAGGNAATGIWPCIARRPPSETRGDE